MPHLSDGDNYDMFQFNRHDLEISREFTSCPLSLGCSDAMNEFARIVMTERDISYPNKPNDAKELFWILVEEIEINS